MSLTPGDLLYECEVIGERLQAMARIGMEIGDDTPLRFVRTYFTSMNEMTENLLDAVEKLGDARREART